MKTFQLLTAAQQTTLLIAIMIRNNLEPMHIAQLSNPQMRELNQVIRYSIYDAVRIIREMNSDSDQAEYFKWLVTRIPDYWEIPGRDAPPDLGYSQAPVDQPDRPQSHASFI